MKGARLRFLRAFGAGILAAAAFAVTIALAPRETADPWRESAADQALLRAPASADDIVVVDIDEASLASLGPWPWPHARLAALIGKVADGNPKAIALDIVLSTPDSASPAAFASHLPADAPADLRAAITALPDPDAGLAAAIGRRPTVLPFLFANAGATPPQPPLLLSGTPPPMAPWLAAGAEMPLPAFAEAAAALGAGSVAEDSDGLVRRVPLLGGVGDTVVAGLAAQTLRLQEGASSLILDGPARRLRIGAIALPLDRAADLRFRPTGPARWAERTVSADQVLSGAVTPDRFNGRTVLIGGGAPALGALWATAASPVAPSVQIQADALATMSARPVPFRPDDLWRIEALALAIGAVLAAIAGAALAPIPAAAAGLALAAAWALAALATIARSGLILDPVTPALAALVAAVIAGTVAAVDQRRLAGAIRRRFERHLAPAIVARLADRPDLLRLEGERREVTVLMTDIEGFTAMTDRIAPAELIRLLDGYFSGVVGIVQDHGGMIDKFVGDAALCVFNAPLDLPDHPRRALDAARRIVAFAEKFARSPAAEAAGLGRTRVGIETGEVVIGDVGAGERLDYTAIGSAVNTAARLEAMNKQFGTAICVGPACRAHLPDLAFTRLGEIEVRGRGTLNLFTPS